MEFQVLIKHYELDKRILSIYPTGWGSGYVVVPEDHEIIEILMHDHEDHHWVKHPHVHGGITYCSRADEDFSLSSEIKDPSGKYIIGFNTSHYGDTLMNWPRDRVLIEALSLSIQLQRSYKYSMERIINSVKKFHETFGVPVATSPTLIPTEDSNLRYALMEEENNEYLAACNEGDIVEIADALGDQLYILVGTMLRHGLQDKIADVFDEIHASNMSKVGADGKPVLREDGKILKGPKYFRPNIKKILDE
jgi:predicted HAD superfamily Cof-like phosphohydrolase